jgi:hypothetical protein
MQTAQTYYCNMNQNKYLFSDFQFCNLKMKLCFPVYYRYQIKLYQVFIWHRTNAPFPYCFATLKCGGCGGLGVNTIFNNISVISCRSVLLMEESKVPGENHRPVESHWQPLSHGIVSSTPRHELDLNSQH